MKLKKTEGIQWKKLEGLAGEEAEVLPVAAAGWYIQCSNYFFVSQYCSVAFSTLQ